MNPYEAPQESTPPESKPRKLGENGGCALGFAVIVSLCTLLCVWGMWEERNTGAREAYMFDMFLQGACFFGVLSLIAYALLYYFRSKAR